MSSRFATKDERDLIEAVYKPIVPVFEQELSHNTTDSHQANDRLASLLYNKLQRAAQKDIRNIRLAIVEGLVITDEVHQAMQDYLLLLKGDEEIQHWLNVCIGHANHIINVLVGGTVTEYEDVDALIYGKETSDFDRFLLHLSQEWVLAAKTRPNQTPLFDWFWLVTVIFNAQDGGRLISNLKLQERRNDAVIKKARHIRWEEKPYAAVLILGQSPEIKDQNIAPLAKEKLRRAMAENEDYKLADLFITCGGTVRPPSTMINEADQLRSLAIEQFDIPQDRIAIEATSQHTYSNFAHAALVGRAMGMPSGSKMIAFPHNEQYDFIQQKIVTKAEKEIQPLLQSFGTFETGPIAGSVVFTLSNQYREFPIIGVYWNDIPQPQANSTGTVFFSFLLLAVFLNFLCKLTVFR